MSQFLRGMADCLLCLGLLTFQADAQQETAPTQTADATAKLIVDSRVTPLRNKTAFSAVIWLSPLNHSAALASTPGSFTLLQKDKMFSPHLLVVPVGSSVAFPNADPFFHNVFSLFDGRRFDLGLYEAGSTRGVVFSREGVSYIFCNIHSEMSAVVISLATPLYSVANSQGAFRIKDVPNGEYELHIWVEGLRQSVLDQKTRRVKVTREQLDLGEIHLDPPHQSQHLNKFGRPYDEESHPIY
jgi:plastocyanin